MIRALALLAALAGCSGRDRPPNIILISMDTVRADHLSTYGHEQETSPFLTLLAKHGTIFEEAFSQSNESAYSHGALFTGRYASELARPIYEQYAIPPDAMLISEILQLYGYETGGFIAGGHVGPGFGFNQGFDHFSAEDGFAFFWHTAPKALAWLDDREHKEDKPYFMVLHGYDAHRPYVVPAPFFHLFAEDDGSSIAERITRSGSSSEQVYNKVFYPDAPLSWFNHSSGAFILEPKSYEALAATGPVLYQGIPLTDEDITHIQHHYDAMIAYADLQIALFLAAAEKSGYLDNTLIIVTADHGEDLLDHEFVNHRTTLYDSCTHVPLIIVGPGFPAGKRVPGLVDALDIVPTILRAAGAEPPAGLKGRALQDVASGKLPPLEEVYIEGVLNMVAVRTDRYKLIFKNVKLDDPNLVTVLETAPYNHERMTLMDLQADPGEHNNLLKDPTPETLALADQLRAKLVAWRKTLTTGTYSNDMKDLDPAVKKSMQDAGYWARDEDKKEGAAPEGAAAEGAAPEGAAAPAPEAPR